eukprot:gnl/Chilomastix_cuspidata/1105.p1 GENE.gnl/Chilomastix_cuspidata/1105~~gnl/Chilomastix_cuspidata/1105.p1  ORF type:complete len:565 (+),score=126.53 gnl/Chilomastix_cuspidata/1105:184-1878(+)
MSHATSESSAPVSSSPSSTTATVDTSQKYSKKEIKRLCQTHKHLEFADGFISNLLVRLSLPTIVSYEVIGLYGVVDTIFIGNSTGTAGLTGFSLFQPIEGLISYLLGIFPCSGASVLIATLLGEKKVQEAEALLTQCMALCFLITTVMAAAFIPNMHGILRLLGASEELADATNTYGCVIAGCGFLLALNNGLGPLLRTEHKAMLAMWRLVVFSILNTVLDAVLLLGTDVGLVGAAIATVVSAGLVGGYLLVWYMNPRSSATCHIRLRYLHPRYYNGARIASMLSLSLPTFAQGSLNYALMVCANLLIYKYVPDTDVANAHISAIGAGLKIFMVVSYFTFGFGYGMMPLLGYNLGAKAPVRAFNTIVTTIFWAHICSLSAEAIVLALANPLARLFGDDQLFLELAPTDVRFIICGFAAQILASVTWMWAMAEQHALVSLLCLFSRFVILIPALFLLPIGFDDPVLGMLCAFPIADVGGFFIALPFFVSSFRRYRRAAHAARSTQRRYTLRTLLACFEMRRTSAMKEATIQRVLAFEDKKRAAAAEPPDNIEVVTAADAPIISNE